MRRVSLAMTIVLVAAGCGTGGAELTVVTTPPSAGSPGTSVHGSVDRGAPGSDNGTGAA